MPRWYVPQYAAAVDQGGSRREVGRPGEGDLKEDQGEARSGEGVLGLRRGFIQAGARNLLMTLWPIDDEKTAKRGQLKAIERKTPGGKALDAVTTWARP